MIQYKGPEGRWKSVFVWKPVRDIHGRWHWLATVYRREKNRVVWPHQGYEWGNTFDALRDIG
jgi:hypothetical protein